MPGYVCHLHFKGLFRYIRAGLNVRRHTVRGVDDLMIHQDDRLVSQFKKAIDSINAAVEKDSSQKAPDKEL
jgi:hypothetical protein